MSYFKHFARRHEKYLMMSSAGEAIIPILPVNLSQSTTTFHQNLDNLRIGFPILTGQ